MTAALEWLVGMTLWTAIVFVLVRIADRLLERRVAARARMALYLAVVVRLLLPVHWDGGIAATTASRAVTSLAASATAAAAAVSSPAPGGGAAGTLIARIVIFGVYVTGVVALVVARWSAVRCSMKELRPARPSLAALSPCVPVFESDGFGPALVGAVHPRIVVPSSLADSLGARALACVVGHEASHATARDPLLLGACQLVAAVAWPVVPMWLALRRVRALMEIACDERALAASPQTGRGEYMRALMDVSERQSLRVRAVALGFGNDAAERLRALGADGRRWPRAVQALTVAALAGAFVGCASSDAASPTPTADYIVVRVEGVPYVEATSPDPSGVDRPIGVHVVSAKFCSVESGEALDLTSPTVIEAKGAALDHAVGSDPDGRGWVRLGGDATVSGKFVAAPSVLAVDGQESTITVSWNEGRPDAQKCGATFRVAGTADGACDLTMSFEQRAGGRVVRTVPSTTIRVREGDAYLFPTRRVE